MKNREKDWWNAVRPEKSTAVRVCRGKYSISRPRTGNLRFLCSVCRSPGALPRDPALPREASAGSGSSFRTPPEPPAPRGGDFALLPRTPSIECSPHGPEGEHSPCPPLDTPKAPPGGCRVVDYISLNFSCRIAFAVVIYAATFTRPEASISDPLRSEIDQRGLPEKRRRPPLCSGRQHTRCA